MKPTYSSTDFLKTAVSVAENFGFQSLPTIAKHPTIKNNATSLPHTANAKDRRKDNLYGLLAGGAATYCEKHLHAFGTPLFVYSIDSVPRTKEIAITYNIYNVPKSIAEVVLVQSLQALVTELGYTNYCVRINSLGDNDSMQRYHRELTTFLRKRIDHLPPTARELMKEHAFLALTHLIEKDHELSYRAPNSLEFLSDTSRKHFREIIEFLDMSDTPYEIDSRLLGHHECYTDALFSLDVMTDTDPAAPELQISGGRYDAFMNHHIGQPVSAVGAVAIVRDSNLPARLPRSRRAAPKVYVIQLGFGPKVRTLMLVDELRRAGIIVEQQLASDSLSEQLRDAERRKSPYAIIMGQKEYVEGNVILRDMKARNQETIEQDKLVRRLKRSFVHR